MSNIHGFGELSENKGGIHNSNSYVNQDDRIYQPSIYKVRSATFVLLVLNISIYIIQLIAFYSYFEKHNKIWGCLLTTFGAFQGGKIKNHYQYYRFITSMFLHNSYSHVGSNSLSLF